MDGLWPPWARSSRVRTAEGRKGRGGSWDYCEAGTSEEGTYRGQRGGRRAGQRDPRVGGGRRERSIGPRLLLSKERESESEPTSSGCGYSRERRRSSPSLAEGRAF